MTSSEGLPRSDLTEIINAMANGDKRAADDLLPLIYEELRILARKRISQEPSGQLLQATDLVRFGDTGILRKGLEDVGVEARPPPFGLNRPGL